MEILGRNYELLLTVGATEEIAALCPDKDLKRMREVLQGGTTAALDFVFQMTAAMSRGAEARRAFLEPGYKPDPLTPEILRLLTTEEVANVQAATMDAFKAGKETSVEADGAKKNEEADAAKGSGST